MLPGPSRTQAVLPVSYDHDASPDSILAHIKGKEPHMQDFFLHKQATAFVRYSLTYIEVIRL